MFKQQYRRIIWAVFLFMLLLPLAVIAASASEKVEVRTSKEPPLDERWVAADRNYRASFFYGCYWLSQQNGRMTEALLFLENAAGVDPDSLLLQRELAEQYEMVGMDEKAAAVLQHLLAREPNDLNREKLTRLYVRLGKSELAENLFLDPDGSDPENPAWLRELASIDVALENYERAVLRLQKLLTITPDDADAMEFLGGVYSRQNRLQEAAETYEKVTCLDPQRLNSMYRLASLLENNQDIEQAVLELEYAVEANPENMILLDALGRLLYRYDRLESADTVFSRLLEVDDADKQSLLYRGTIRLRQHRFDEAIRDFAQLEYIDPENPALFYGQGMAWMMKDQDKKAEKAFLKQLKLAPQASPAYERLAYIYDRQNRLQDASEILQQGLKNCPDSPDLYILLAAALSDEKNFKEASKVLKRGIDRVPKKEEDFRFQLALLYDRQKQFGQARRELETIIKFNRNNARALNYLGYSLADRGEDLDKAEQMVAQATKLEPKSIYYRDSLAWVWYRQGKFGQARELMERVVAEIEGHESPDDAIMLEHLGDIYDAMGEYKKAARSYLKALSLDPREDLKVKAGLLADPEDGVKTSDQPVLTPVEDGTRDIK